MNNDTRLNFVFIKVSPLETFNSLHITYGDTMVSRATMYCWYEAFEKDRASASCRAVTEVIVNTAAAIIQQQLT